MSVKCTVTEGVAVLLFDRPEKLNALTDRMWEQLQEHVERCRRDDAVRAVILTGAGRAFCAGADMSGAGRVWPRKPGREGSIETMTRYNDVVRLLYHLPKPTIAAVNGAAVGIAWTMALCCDWVLAGDGAKFRPAFLNLAKVPEGGFQFLAARLIGQLKARDLVYRSAFVSGAEAVALGLATRLVPDSSLLDEATRLAREQAAGAPLAFALSKQLFNADSGDFDAFLAMELQAIAAAANTQDAIEGTAAFQEKRVPIYSGR